MTATVAVFVTVNGRKSMCSTTMCVGGGRLPQNYFRRLVRRWGLGHWIDELPERTVKQMVSHGDLRFLLNDDAAICVALAQAVVDGRVLRGVTKKARVALRRQGKPFVLAYRGYVDPEDVAEVLREIEAQIC